LDLEDWLQIFVRHGALSYIGKERQNRPQLGYPRAASTGDGRANAQQL
jgi:hypothetical protein